MNFEEIAQMILSFPKKDLGTGVDDHEIESAVHTLNIPICGGYRRFLRRFGFARIADFDVFGLGNGIPRYLHLVVVTESERNDVDPPLPEHLLPIMNNGGGDLVCLDTRASPEEPPIVMWWHEDGPDQVPEPTATDFLSWLSTMVEERAKDQQNSMAE